MTTPDRTLPVTVLLPVHNGGRHLAAAVESILGQTHRDLELLVVDDGSTDGSGELLDHLVDPRVRVLHQPNRGLVVTLNTGLEKATHNLVARMDADDVSDPRRLELQVRHLAEHPQVAAVGCCYDVIDEDDTVVRSVHTAASVQYLHRQLYFRNVLPHAGMTFRRSAVLAVGGYRDVGPVEDYDLWIRLSAEHELASLPERLLRYRVTPTGISVRARDEQLRCLRRVRAELHATRPMPAVAASSVVEEGLRHAARYGPTCPAALRTYVFDHLWLAVQVAGVGHRVGAAARLLAGTVALVVRRPAAAGAFLDVLRRRDPAGTDR
jgi:glycosyltransferase involved in cell wall biosynthesis